MTSTTIVLTTAATIRALMRVQSENQDLDHWHRIGCLAWVHTDRYGHARMATGQAARELGLTVKQTSAAIETARTRGWIDLISTARCLVLPGCGSNPCEENHR